MNWSDITDDWPLWSQRIRNRFPCLEPGAMKRSRHNRAAFEAYLARAHNLSLTEAREEIEDFLYLEALTREVSRPRRMPAN